jgi:uncharacterized protein (DUF1800 family)
METWDPAIAAHRFGLGERDLAAVGADARGWLLGQLGPGEPEPGLAEDPLAASASRLQLGRRLRRARRAAAARPPDPGRQGKLRVTARPPPAPDTAPEATERDLVEAVQRDVLRRLRRALTTRRPFAERLLRFFGNHFAVSAAKGPVRGLVAPFEREALAPRLAGSFRELLRAAVTHPAMLIYLDNVQSFGPDSPIGLRRRRGLNENLAREVLELHTLGVRGGYTQADVEALAAVLTGWSVDPRTGTTAFFARRHQPGPKRLLGRDIPEGGEAELDRALDLLAQHPATAAHVSLRLARHFVADEPPAGLVLALTSTFRESNGDLTALARTLLTHPEAWSPAPVKIRPPEDWALAALRIIGLRDVPDRLLVRTVDRFARLAGHPPGRPPSPEGFPDDTAAWLGPDALLKRIEWATLVGRRSARELGTTARLLARQALGSRLSSTTDDALLSAADEGEALTMLLVSPEVLFR